MNKHKTNYKAMQSKEREIIAESNPALMLPSSGSVVVESIHSPLSNPKIFLSNEAIRKISNIVAFSQIEVSWFGTVERNGSNFLIKDIIIPNQEGSAATTDISSDSISDVLDYVLENHSAEEARVYLKELCFWGHSHVDMRTLPSGQDVETASTIFPDGSAEFLIAAIFNKRGETRFDIYWFKDNIKYLNVPWYPEICNVERDESIFDELKEKVSLKRTKRTLVPFGLIGDKERHSSLEDAWRYGEIAESNVLRDGYIQQMLELFNDRFRLDDDENEDEDQHLDVDDSKSYGIQRNKDK